MRCEGQGLGVRGEVRSEVRSEGRGEVRGVG